VYGVSTCKPLVSGFSLKPPRRFVLFGAFGDDSRAVKNPTDGGYTVYLLGPVRQHKTVVPAPYFERYRTSVLRSTEYASLKRWAKSKAPAAARSLWLAVSLQSYRDLGITTAPKCPDELQLARPLLGRILAAYTDWRLRGLPRTV
jgi:hypothetical protein